MSLSRKQIEIYYKKLQDLKSMEEFIENQAHEEKKMWLTLKSPRHEYNFVYDDIRSRLIEFVKLEIDKIKNELNLED